MALNISADGATDQILPQELPSRHSSQLSVNAIPVLNDEAFVLSPVLMSACFVPEQFAILF